MRPNTGRQQMPNGGGFRRTRGAVGNTRHSRRWKPAAYRCFREGNFKCLLDIARHLKVNVAHVKQLYTKYYADAVSQLHEHEILVKIPVNVPRGKKRDIKKAA